MSISRSGFWVCTVLLLLAGAARGELVLHLPFDRDPHDHSGAGHHAEPQGGARLDADQFQLGGGSALLPGASNACFRIPVYAPVLGDAPRTVAFWLRSTRAFQSSPNVVFLGWGDAGPLEGVRYDLGLQNGDPTRLRLEFNAGRFVVSDAGGEDFSGGQWHHLLVSCDESQVRFFVDGRPYGQAVPLPLRLRTGVGPAGTVIGASVRDVTEPRMQLADRAFTGHLDDVGVWSSALDEVDAALLHGLGRVGDNALRWHRQARQLWDRPLGSKASLNGWTWQKVSGLKGQPGDWVQVGGPNGAGSFIVLSATGEGIQLVPQLWDYGWVQWPALSAGLLAVVGLLWWIADRLRWRMRLRRLEERELAERERRRIAQDLHDDLGSSLTEIMQLGDLAAKEDLSSQQLRARLAAITGKTRAMIAAVDEIVWTANPVNDLLPRLAEYLCDHAREFVRAGGMACRLEVMDEVPAVVVSARVRHHVLLAVKEALNNAVKYSAATEVWLRVHYQNDELRLEIEDNGQGFDPATVKPGNGLANLRSRLTELGGHTEIRSQPGHGTRVVFTLRLNSAGNRTRGSPSPG